MLKDRMMLSECVELVARMMTAYPDHNADDGYIGAIAAVLAEFPRVVAVAAASPVHGVPKEYRQYKPTAGQVMAWCERDVQFYRRMVEQGLDRQALPAPVDRSNRPTLDELRARYGPNWGLKTVMERKASDWTAPSNEQLLKIYGRIGDGNPAGAHEEAAAGACAGDVGGEGTERVVD